jgi:hypothetical protein
MIEKIPLCVRDEIKALHANQSLFGNFLAVDTSSSITATPEFGVISLKG